MLDKITPEDMLKALIKQAGTQTHHGAKPDRSTDKTLSASIVLVLDLHHQTACKADRIDRHS